jgi:hypothetical protein
MKNIKEYKTTSEWHKDARSEGYSFPLAMCHGLDVGQRKLKLSFPDVFELFVKNNIIIQVNDIFIYNLEGYLAIKKIKIKL